jgi:hypothetical protein
MMPIVWASAAQRLKPGAVGVSLPGGDSDRMLFSHEMKNKRHKRHSDREALQIQGFQRDTTFSPMMSLPSFLPGQVQIMAAAALAARRVWIDEGSAKGEMTPSRHATSLIYPWLRL